MRCCLLQEAGVELVAGVRAGLKQRMMDVDWLDDETRKLSIEKVTLCINNLECSRERFFSNSAAGGHSVKSCIPKYDIQ